MTFLTKFILAVFLFTKVNSDMLLIKAYAGFRGQLIKYAGKFLFDSTLAIRSGCNKTACLKHVLILSMENTRDGTE